MRGQGQGQVEFGTARTGASEAGTGRIRTQMGRIGTGRARTGQGQGEEGREGAGRAEGGRAKAGKDRQGRDRQGWQLGLGGRSRAAGGRSHWVPPPEGPCPDLGVLRPPSPHLEAGRGGLRLEAQKSNFAIAS